MVSSESQISRAFRFEDHRLRAEIVDGVPWFVARDVCSALGIEHYRNALQRLDDDERGSVTVNTPGGPQSMAACSESGLYTLILRSNSPEARPFRRWVTHEVLPAIRQTGGYSIFSSVRHGDLQPMPRDEAHRSIRSLHLAQSDGWMGPEEGAVLARAAILSLAWPPAAIPSDLPRQTEIPVPDVDEDELEQLRRG